MKVGGPRGCAYKSPCNPRRGAPPTLTALSVLDEFLVWLVLRFGINPCFCIQVLDSGGLSGGRGSGHKTTSHFVLAFPEGSGGGASFAFVHYLVCTNIHTYIPIYVYLHVYVYTHVVVVLFLFVF